MGTIASRALAPDASITIHGPRALRHVEELCRLGDRFVGQPGDAAAENYIAQQFQEAGLRLERTAVQLPGWRQDEASLEVEGESLDVSTAYFSPSTAGTLEAELVYAADGEEAAYAGLDVTGKIVVLEERSIGYSLFWLGGFVERAARRGALAVLVIHPAPKPYRMSMEAGLADISRRFCAEKLPAASVSCGGGLRIMSALGRGRAVARLRLIATSGPASTNFLAGVQEGATHPRERVIVMAHRDNGAPPGANDDAAGTATMIEVAHLLAGRSTQRSLVYLSSAGEEGVAEGTVRYIEALGDSVADIKGVISLDMFAVGGRLNLVDRAFWPDRPEPLRHDGHIMSLLERAADGRGYHVGRMDADWGAAESGRFLEAGVPAAWFWKSDDPSYHSPADVPEGLDGNMIKIVGEITAETVVRLAGTVD